MCQLLVEAAESERAVDLKQRIGVALQGKQRLGFILRDQSQLYGIEISTRIEAELAELEEVLGVVQRAIGIEKIR